jgi:hypothetical protein
MMVSILSLVLRAIRWSFCGYAGPGEDGVEDEEKYKLAGE